MRRRMRWRLRSRRVGSVGGVSHRLLRPSLGRSTSHCRRPPPPGVRGRGRVRERGRGRASPGGDLLLHPHPHPLPARTPTAPTTHTRTTRTLSTLTLPPRHPLIAPLHGGREGRQRGREGGRGRGIGTHARLTRPGDLIRTTTATTAVGVRIGGLGRGRTSGVRVRVRGVVGEEREWWLVGC